MKKSIKLSERGDSLVEVVVSFCIVLLALAAVTTMVLTAGKLNMRADLASGTLRSSVNDIEASPHSADADSSLTVRFDGGASVDIPVAVENSGSIEFFYPN